MLQGRDLANEYQSGVSLAPSTRTSSADGAGVDFRDCGPEVVSIVSYAGTALSNEAVGTCIVKLQESDDNSTFTDISGATHTTLTQTKYALGAANANEVKVFAKRAKRYVRAVATIAGTSPSFATSVVVAAPKMSY